MRQLVEERLVHERDSVAPRRAERPGWNPMRNRRRPDEQIRRVSAGEFSSARSAEHAMRLPSTDLPVGLDGPLEITEASFAIEVVTHIVFARPHELHRCAYALG